MKLIEFLNIDVGIAVIDATPWFKSLNLTAIKSESANTSTPYVSTEYGRVTKSKSLFLNA